MKIIELKAQNVKNLKAIEIKADGKSVILSGKNEVGKSSVIDAITMALTGQMVERPIKDGESRAEVTLNLGDYIVKRIWTDKGNRLEVINPDGAKYTSPQMMLDKIIGSLSFDPLEFKNMEKKAQRDLLVRLVGLDFTEHDRARKELFDKRTYENRILVDLEARLRGIKAPDVGVPENEIILAEEIEKINALEKLKKEHDYAMRDKEGLNDKIAEQERIIKEAEGRIALAKHNIEVYQGAIAALFIPNDVPQQKIDDARTVLKQIEDTNVKIRAAKFYKVAKEAVESSNKTTTDMTTELQRMDAEKIKQITEVKYPVSGLSVSEDCVLFMDIPFSQAAEGIKIRVSTAIAMKLNPKLRVILIKEASLLDSDNLKAIIDMAKEADYQLWLERVSDAGNIEVHIED